MTNENENKDKTKPTGESPTIPDQENLSDLQKLKNSNAELEAELIKGRELRTETQKLEAEKMLSGTTGGKVEAKMVSPEDKKVNEAKDFFKGTGLGDTIGKANE